MGEPRIHAVMVTFERPDAALATLEDLQRQSRPPASTTVVDNSRPEKWDDRLAEVERATLIRTGENIGPAGALDVGARHVLEAADDGDWLLFVDDDDPPANDHILEELIAFGRAAAAGTQVGGVGLAGGRFDLQRGLLHRVPDHELRGAVAVDYLGGNQFPCYPVEALRAVGTPRRDLFFGFDDLELGLRLRSAGYELLVDGDRWLAQRAALGRTGMSARQAAVLRRRSSWRRYYGARNLVWLSRTYGSRRAAMTATVRSALLAGGADVVRSRSVRGAGPAFRGGLDAWRDALGRTVDPACEEC